MLDLDNTSELTQATGLAGPNPIFRVGLDNGAVRGPPLPAPIICSGMAPI